VCFNNLPWIGDRPASEEAKRSMDVKKQKRIVPYSQMEAEDCPLGGKHNIWISYVGDSWPAFCSNKGCNTVSKDRPMIEGDL